MNINIRSDWSDLMPIRSRKLVVLNNCTVTNLHSSVTSVGSSVAVIFCSDLGSVAVIFCSDLGSVAVIFCSDRSCF